MKTLNEVIKAFECCEHGEPYSNCKECSYIGIGSCCLERENDAIHYLKAFRDAKNALDAEREKSIEAYCQWKDAKEKLEAQTSQMMWVDNHFQFEISDNPPLTWDELKQMEGQPVWVEQCNGDAKGWLLILRTNYDVINCTTKHGNSFYLYKSLYGGKWQAYRKERGNERNQKR